MTVTTALHTYNVFITWYGNRLRLYRSNSWAAASCSLTRVTERIAPHGFVRAGPGHLQGYWGQLYMIYDIDTSSATRLGVEWGCWTVIRRMQPPSLIRFLMGCKRSCNQLWRSAQVSTHTMLTWRSEERTPQTVHSITLFKKGFPGKTNPFWEVCLSRLWWEGEWMGRLLVFLSAAVCFGWQSCEW